MMQNFLQKLLFATEHADRLKVQIFLSVATAVN